MGNPLCSLLSTREYLREVQSLLASSAAIWAQHFPDHQEYSKSTETLDL